jgi:hypothetical protein
MSAPRKPTYAQQQKTVVALSREIEIRDRLVQVKEQQISELRAHIAELEAPPAPMVPLQRAAFNAGITGKSGMEKLRRWCERGKVDAELLHGTRWIVDERSLADYLRQTR